MFSLLVSGMYWLIKILQQVATSCVRAS